MTKRILITGATDGIGLATAKTLAKQQHPLIIHGRNAKKLEEIAKTLGEYTEVSTVQADLSDLAQVQKMANQLLEQGDAIDVLINNAGIFRTDETITVDQLDIRFAVNTIAPFMLSQALKPLFTEQSRVVNVSSAAQAPVNLAALQGLETIAEDFQAYAQSKLAITALTVYQAQSAASEQVYVAVNPGSMLGSKMVQQGFGVQGADLQIGADILSSAAVSEQFSDANGLYFDNDSHQFARAHEDSYQNDKTTTMIASIEETLNKMTL